MKRILRYLSVVGFATLMSITAAPAVNALTTSTTDLFEGATVTDSIAGPGVYGGLFLGGNPEQELVTNVIFPDATTGTVNYVNFSTPSPVTIAGVRLTAGSDGAAFGNRRGMNRFVLKADVDNDSIYEATLIDQAINVDYSLQAGNVASNQAELDLSLNFAPITAASFRAEFVQGVDTFNWDGVRVQELDAIRDREVFVYDNTSQTIDAFDINSSGAASPRRTINNVYSYWGQVAVDQNYIYSFNNNRIDVFAKGATGAALPVRSITGVTPPTMGLAIDDNFIYVPYMDVSYVVGRVKVYDKSASGAVGPVRTLDYACTEQMGVAVDDNYLYAACYGENAIKVLPVDGNGTVVPVRTITTAPVHGIAVDTNYIYAASYNTGEVSVHNLNANGVAAPLRTITGLTAPVQIVVDDTFMYVAETSRMSVYRLTDNGNVAPVRSITGFTNLGGVAIDSVADTATLTVATSGNGTVVSSPVGIVCGASCSADFVINSPVTLTATPATGSVFSGWSGACTNVSGPCEVTMDASKGVTATFTLETHALTVATVGSGSVAGTGISCGADCDETFDYGTVVTLTATPATDYGFAGWSGAGCSGTGDCIVTMDAAKNVTATFAALPRCAPISGIYGTGSNTTGSYTITWYPSATPNVTYVLYENDAPVYNGTGLSYSVSGKGNGIYNYKVRGFRDGYVATPLKGTAQVTVTLATACAKINGIKIVKYANGNYQVVWNASATSGSSYVLYVDSGSGWGVAYSGNNRYLNVANPAPGTYRYKVVATNGTLLPSPDSNIAQVTINP